MDFSTIQSYSDALCGAARNGHLVLAEHLLGHGADVNYRTAQPHRRHERNSRTPLDLAVHYGHLQMVQLLLKYKPDLQNTTMPPLIRAADRGHLEIVKTLLSHRPSEGNMVTEQDSAGLTALARASFRGHLDIVQCLVNHGGADVKYTKPEEPANETANGNAAAIYWASYEGKTDVMEFLLEIGANPSVCIVHRGHADTPLSIAARHGHLNAVRLLLRNHADKATAFEHLPLLSERDDGMGRNVGVLLWLSKDPQRNILSLKALAQEGQEAGHIIKGWDAIVTILWLDFYGVDHEEQPPLIADTACLSEEEFKIAYQWMVPAISSLLFIKGMSELLDQLFQVLPMELALKPNELTGKIPLQKAIDDMFPKWNENRNAMRGVEVIARWNPQVLKPTAPQDQLGGDSRFPLLEWGALDKGTPMSTLAEFADLFPGCTDFMWAPPSGEDEPRYLFEWAANRDCDVSVIFALMSPNVVIPWLKRMRVEHASEAMG